MPPTATQPPPRRRDGVLITEHRLPVPLDHAQPGETITVFARELVRADRAADGLPCLLWLQGGPGMPAERPSPTSGWLARVLEDFRVILLDQRGTGLSAPVTRATLPLNLQRQALAARLSLFRTSAIIADAEALRRHLRIDSWSLLGQSFGGFLAVAYLSQHPEALDRVLITAGLPSLAGDPDAVYRRTFQATARACDRLFAAFPEAEGRAWEIASHLLRVPERLPSGEPLSVERFQTLGIVLGTAAGVNRLGYLLESAFVDTADGRRLSETFLREAEAIITFAHRPLYAVLHEAIYSRGEPTRWSAHRVRSEFAEFNLAGRLGSGGGGVGSGSGGGGSGGGDGLFRFTGEMVFPWQFAQDRALVPFAPAAEVLAQSRGMGDPFDDAVLAANTVPVAAAVFTEDMFVPAELSLRTAEAIRGIRLLVTNEHHHDGIRTDGALLVSKLLDLLAQ